MNKIILFARLLRVSHWVKNLFLFIPLFFSGEIFNYSKVYLTSIGFLAFCIVASSIYILNDIKDLEFDKRHEEKSKRPIAAGKITKSTALILCVLLSIIGLSISFFLQLNFFFLLVAYFGINFFYSFGLKNISILDVILISCGFAIRIFAGGFLGDIYITEWLVIMVFLLSLFMAFAKRRDDVLIRNQNGTDIRLASKKYNLEFINTCISILAAIVILAYIMYTISPEVISRFHTDKLYFTSIFVITGILRYLQLTLVEENSSSPTKILFKDIFLQVTLIFWILAFYFIIYLNN
ncbi:MAG: UbiA prenyltransferase family protein [Flammeovirgaceae bacterium]|nr:UbiA prenyltransferase family protein [Flammeovirgaceae bacterium]